MCVLWCKFFLFGFSFVSLVYCLMFAEWYFEVVNDELVFDLWILWFYGIDSCYDCGWCCFRWVCIHNVDSFLLNLELLDSYLVSVCCFCLTCYDCFV